MEKITKNLKKSILGALLGASVLAFAGPVSFADAHCKCDDKCTEQCATGDHKDCKCKTCSCGKGKKCKHGKCNHEAKAAPAAGQAH